MTDFRALCAELLRIADDYHPDRNEDCPLALTQMREAVSELAESLLTHPEPEEPTDEALASFTAYFCRNYPGPDTIIHKPEWHAPKIFHAAADALARWPRAAIKPVPVSERPLLRPLIKIANFNDANGHCWCGTRASIDKTGDLPVKMPSSWELREPCAQDDCVLPHYAMPIPTTPTEANGQT